MRFMRITFALVSVCALAASAAVAETYTVSDDVDPPDMPDLPVPEAADYGGCDACYAPSGPWQVYPRDCRGYEVGGWVQTGYHTEGANGVGVFRGADGDPFAFGFNKYPNVVQLQQAWVYAQKVADTCGYGWDWGFRVDYVYGTDGPNTQAFGSDPARNNIWDTSWDAGIHYGHAIPQLYGEVAYNNMKVKAGKFFTPLGYEQVAAPQNFFYSHSLSFSVLEPYTHTGVLAEYAVGCQAAVYGGWTMGWDTGFDQNGGNMILGGVRLNLCDTIRLSYMAAMGDFGFAPKGTDPDAYLHSVVLDWDVTCRMKYVLQTDYLDASDGFPLADWTPMLTINQYLLYQVNCQWAVGGRFEWMNWDNHRNPDTDFGEITLGANYRPHCNVVIRPEVRLDIFDSSLHNTYRDSTVFGVDAIVMY